LRWECPPEGAKNRQGYTLEILELISPTGFIGFHRNWKDLQRGGKGANSTQGTEREKNRGGSVLLTEGGKENLARSPEDRRRWWPPVEIAGGGEIAAGQRARALAGKQEASGPARAGGRFLKREMGTPDSLQWLSGAHRTAHSSCPVNHRTAHRKRGILRAAAGAPDIAQCSVRCTPDCPVSPDRGEFGKF